MSRFTRWAEAVGAPRCPWCGCYVRPGSRTCRQHTDLERQRDAELRASGDQELEHEVAKLEGRGGRRRRLRGSGGGGSMAPGSIHNERKV